MSQHPLHNESPEQPKPPSTTYRNVYYPSERGGCLSVWIFANFAIIGFAVLSLCGAFFTMFNRDVRFDRLPGSTQALMLGGIVLLGVWIICLIAIWYWKKWGVYGFILCSFLNLGLEITLSPQTLDSFDFLSPFISSGLLLYLVTSRWSDFD